MADEVSSEKRAIDITEILPYGKWSTLFRQTDGDSHLTFRSSDNMLFSIHKTNIETHALGFPPAEFAAEGEIVPLPEEGQILELLFQFIYPSSDLPDLDEVPFKVTMELAEAAEKYEVSLLIYTCKRWIRTRIPVNPKGVLEYACKHQDPELIGEVIPYMLKTPLSEVAAIAPSHYFVAWARYMENWHNALLNFARYVEDRRICHPEMGKHIVVLLLRIGDLERLCDAEAAFNPHEDDRYCCTWAPSGRVHMREHLKKEVKKLPKFMELLAPKA